MTNVSNGTTPFNDDLDLDRELEQLQSETTPRPAHPIPKSETFTAAIGLGPMLRRYNDSSPPNATTRTSRGRLAAIGISICIVAGGSVAIVANTNVTSSNTTVVVEVHGGGSQVAVNGGTNN